ncbi:RNA polymerase sigma factor [Carboxylicivirga taeanensis]|uniref:RNA polymerase sigma factor n=1 Tax=Carboxylicivirga taeanensis TaxID=1416875 RepID=UPI003F6E2AEA
MMKLAGNQIEYNSTAFKDIFIRLFPTMCMLASRILNDGEKAKDIAQEAFVKLWQNDAEEFTDENAMRAYLYVLVKNACISLIRKEKKTSNTPLNDELPAAEKVVLDEILREETYQLLRSAIEELSPQASQVVNLALKGYSNLDIADELGVTLNTVKTVKKRAYKALRDKLGSQFVSILLTSFIKFF